MKKFLLAFVLLFAVQFSNAQNVILNEVFVNETATEPEFIELVNTGTSVTGENLNCYSIAVYYYNQASATEGFYILDLPDTTLSSQKYFILSSQSSFTFNDSLVSVGFNWNAPTASSSLKQYTLNNSGNAYTSQAITSNNILMRSNGRRNGNNGVYAIFLFYNGQVIDVLLGGQNNQMLPNFISDLPDLPAGSLACSTSPVNISTLDDNASIVANVNAPIINSGGYYRTNNNRCGEWRRGNNSMLTPGRANEAIPALLVSSLFVCGSSNFTYSLMLTSGTLNVTGNLYYDVNNNATLDVADVLISTNVNTASNVPFSTTVIPNASLILVLNDNTATACNNTIVYYNCIQGGPTPVTLKNFNAVKRSGTVSLTWETASESNNRGFEIQRKTNRGYEVIGFVPSQSADGNTSSGYRYAFEDAARHTGIVYYRLRQVDFAGQSRMSEVKALRFTGNILVSVFPNPAVNHNTNVVLPEDAGMMQIALYDFTGRIVQKWDNNRATNIPLNNLKSGAYTLKVILSESGEMITQRIIVP